MRHLLGLAALVILPAAALAQTGASLIGAASRHCYAAEARQPAPRARPHAGAHWSLALSDGNRAGEVISATVRTSSTIEAAARHLGCGV